MARILVTEEIADSGLDKLRAAGHEVDVALGLSPDELLAAIPGAHALIIRSSTQVTAEVLSAGRDLVVVGRAGSGRCRRGRPGTHLRRRPGRRARLHPGSDHRRGEPLRHGQLCRRGS